MELVMPHQPFKLPVQSDCERKASPLQEDAFDSVGRHETSSIDHLSNASNINILDKEQTSAIEDSFTEKASTSLSSIHKQKYGPSVSGDVQLMELLIPHQPFKLPIQLDCAYCGAKKFAHESKMMCCSDGRITLAMTVIPTELYRLFTSKDDDCVNFRKYVRAYNNMFAFTSLGVAYDKKLAQMSKDQRPSYLQLYFYDTEHEAENRTSVFDSFEEQIVKSLMDILRMNPYAVFFRSLKDINVQENLSIAIRCDPHSDQRVYNRPTVSQVAGIWTENQAGVANQERSIVVRSHSGQNHKIQSYFGCYDPLQYPLLFPYGETGWCEGIIKIDKNDHLSIDQAQSIQRTTIIDYIEDLIQRETSNECCQSDPSL